MADVQAQNLVFSWHSLSADYVGTLTPFLMVQLPKEDADCFQVELIGYAGRAYSAHEAPDFTLTPYIAQSLLLLLGPSFFAASIYMILGRIIRLTGGDTHSLIRPKRLTKIFVLGDVLSFFIQSGGECWNTLTSV